MSDHPHFFPCWLESLHSLFCCSSSAAEMGITFGKEQPDVLDHLSDDHHSSPVVHYRGNRQLCVNGDGEFNSPRAGIDYTPMLPPRFATLMDPRSPTDGVHRTPLQVLPQQVLLLDPRSPSIGIERTPIQAINFDSKQIPSQVLPHSAVLTDPRSPSAGIDRTPIQISAKPAALADPRSPTVGIERTPILTLKPQSQLVEDFMEKNCVQQEAFKSQSITTELDPRSPSVGIKRTPIVWIGKHVFFLLFFFVHT